MESGDWVTLIVSVVTVIASVAGAHKVAERQDKRNATMALFAKIREDIHRLHGCFAEYIMAECDYAKYEDELQKGGLEYDLDTYRDKQEKQSARIEAAKEACKKEYLSFDTNVFVVSLVVGDKQSQKLQADLQQLREYVLDQVEQWEDNGKMLISMADGIGETTLEKIETVEAEMKKTYSNLSALDIWA